MPEFELVSSASVAWVSLAALLIVAIFGVVIAPAVWSRKRTRRAAATAVLQQILDVVRAWGGGGGSGPVLSAWPVGAGGYSDTSATRHDNGNFYYGGNKHPDSG